MLKNCPECALPVSDKAQTCPHCGYPLKTFSKTTHRKKSRIRLPNGFGQISELKGQNLRNPYRAMVTVGKDANGRPICKTLKPQGYFKTYNEAYAALVEYNKSPYDLADSIRMYELYDRWSAEYFKTLKSDSSIRTITSAWRYCASIYNLRVSEVRAKHIKNCIENGVVKVNGVERGTSPNMKSRIKSLLNIMLDYAVEYEMTDRNYARTFELSKDVIKEQEDVKRSHITFTKDEMVMLWKNINVPFVRMILIQCYTGFRPQELCQIKIENVNLAECTIIGGMKTEAGEDRIVPINSLILGFVKEEYQSAVAKGSKHLFQIDGSPIGYDKYRRSFENIMKDLALNQEHRPHDPRKQYITMAKECGVDEYAIKRIVGHKISDITEKVYTDRPVSWLIAENEKIKGM